MRRGMEKSAFRIGHKTVVDFTLRRPAAIAQIPGHFIQIEQILQTIPIFVVTNHGRRFPTGVLGATRDVNPPVRTRLHTPARVGMRALRKFKVAPIHYFSTGTAIPRMMIFCANRKTSSVGTAAMRSEAKTTPSPLRCCN